MLTKEQNHLLSQTECGTPMGDLLRRYWMPIAAVSEFDGQTIKPVRLLGEDLVLYRDLSGTFGLVDRHCPHRRADLSYGFVETSGLRCNYHGWCYDERGRCVEQPFDDTANPEARFKDKITITAYPVQAKAGLLWAYLGPQPAPLVPTWEQFTWKNGFVQIVFSTIPCNWFQGQENSIDPIHFEWMHRNWTLRLNGRTGPYGKKHVRLGFDEFEHGFVYRRLIEDMPETHERWTVGRVCLWPNALMPSNHFEWRVPIDDENTLSVTWHFSRVPNEREPYVQESIPSWVGPIVDERGRWITSHVMNQDFVAWLGQGRIADRTREHLGGSDRGVTMIRKRFFADMEAVARGEEPKAIVRDPERNRCIELPILNRQLYIEGLPLQEMLDDPMCDPRNGYAFQAGQPESVRQAFLHAMGIEGWRADSDGSVVLLSGAKSHRLYL